jgi:FlaA1/EpsC-like NDP-sugar epimerase
MTIPEACQLILQAGSMGEGGEIFILEMGVPIKIADMAKDLIRLSGFEPNVDIDIKYVGLRPGEKLMEELITDGEGIVKTSHEKIMVLRGQVCEIEKLNHDIEEIMGLVAKEDGEGIKRKLREILPEYAPQEKR